MERRRGYGRGNTMNTDGAGPIYLANLGGGRYPAVVDVFQLIMNMMITYILLCYPITLIVT